MKLSGVPVWTLALLLSAPGVTVAQSPIAWSGGLGFSSTSYDKQVTGAQYSDRGFGIQGLLAPRFYDYFSVMAELGWEYLGQVCLEDPCDADKTSTSSRYAAIAAGFVSPSVAISDNDASGVGIGISGYGGYQHVNAGLSEDNCINCTIDDLEVNGGFFVEGSLDIYTGSEVALGFAFRKYGADADLDSRFTLRAVYVP